MSNKEIFSIEIKGIDEMIARLDKIPDEALDVLEKTLVENAHHLINESKKQCPVDTGRLRGTATVGKTKRRSRDVTVEAGYGTDYAIYVHENTDAKHSIESTAAVARRIAKAEAAADKRYQKRVQKALAEGRRPPERKPYKPTAKMTERRAKHGQKAKFLEDPLKENANYYQRRNEAALRDYFANLDDQGGGPSGS